MKPPNSRWHPNISSTILILVIVIVKVKVRARGASSLPGLGKSRRASSRRSGRRLTRVFKCKEVAPPCNERDDSLGVDEYIRCPEYRVPVVSKVIRRSAAFRPS